MGKRRQPTFASLNDTSRRSSLSSNDDMMRMLSSPVTVPCRRCSRMKWKRMMVGGWLEPRGPVNCGGDDGESAQLLQILTSMHKNWGRKEEGNDCHWEGRVIDINIQSYLDRAHVDETFALSIHLNLALNCF
jgi:hypothetical protein